MVLQLANSIAVLVDTAQQRIQVCLLDWATILERRLEQRTFKKQTTQQSMSIVPVSQYRSIVMSYEVQYY